MGEGWESHRLWELVVPDKGKGAIDPSGRSHAADTRRSQKLLVCARSAWSPPATAHASTMIGALRCASPQRVCSSPPPICSLPPARPQRHRPLSFSLSLGRLPPMPRQRKSPRADCTALDRTDPDAIVEEAHDTFVYPMQERESRAHWDQSNNLHNRCKDGRIRSLPGKSAYGSESSTRLSWEPLRRPIRSDRSECALVPRNCQGARGIYTRIALTFMLLLYTDSYSDGVIISMRTFFKLHRPNPPAPSAVL